MLTEKEKAEIDKYLKHYPREDAARIEALRVVQEHRKWVSDESIDDIAAYLEMSPEAIESVATYYNLIFRRPVGRHVILVCDSVSCWILGYEKILEHLIKTLKVELGGTTEDDRFTLLPIACLGTCDKAPALMINDDLHRNLTTDKLDEILENYE